MKTEQILDLEGKIKDIFEPKLINVLRLIYNDSNINAPYKISTK